MLPDTKCVLFITVLRRFRTRRGLIFNPFLFLSTFPLHFNLLTVMTQPLDPRTKGRSGRLAVQSPRKGYEPTTPVISAVQRLLQ